MDNKVIEVLDYMGEKLGIAIDWTSENVMPQVTEFMGRYQVYAIVRDSVWVLISIIVVFTAAYILKKVVTQRIKMEGIFWEEDELTFVAAVFSCIALVLCTILAIVNIFTIIEWSFVPEMKFIETFSDYLKNVK